jgi:predicted nucleic acid-binding protein
LTDKIVIADASCLIALDRISKLIILQKLFSVIYTTPEIRKEFGTPLPDWIVITQLQTLERKNEFQKIVDEGEASAIALALEINNCILVIDEKKGRRLAKQLGIYILGTLRILLLAKSKGIIDSVLEIITKLEKKNFRFSKAVKEQILKEAGESA